MAAQKIILAIDDSPLQLRTYKYALGSKYDFRAVESAADAIHFLNNNKVDAILLDINMPEINGFEFIDNIRTLMKDLYAPIIIISGDSDESFRTKAKNTDAFAVLTKPVEADILTETVERAMSAPIQHKKIK